MAAPTKANVSRPEAWGYDALIEYGDTDAESLYLRLAVGPGRQLSFQTVEPSERGPDLSENPEDMRTESGRPFSRSSFSGGEGLDRAHRRNGTDRDWSRFWDSRNVDVTPALAGEQEAVRLLHTASSLRSADAGGTTRMPLVKVGTVLYGVVDDDTMVDRTADPTASSPTWTQEDPGGSGSIQDLAALGDEVYAAQGGTEIRKRSSAGLWAGWSSLNALRIWSAKGRIIGSDGTGLYEAGASSDTLLHTLASGESWNDVVDAGAAILAAASDGYVYAFAEQDGELVLKGQTFFPGEEPVALGFGQGLVFIGTSEATTGGGAVGRLWRSLLVGLRLRESQVVRTWGDGSTTRDQAPRRIISTREAVWTGVIEDASETHLWRYHLTTGGLVRDLILSDVGLVEGLAVFDDRMFATVADEALWREDTTYASSGYLISPLADFYSASRKAWVGARLSSSHPANTTVTLAYSTDKQAIEAPADSSWTSAIAATAAAPGDDEETAITGVESRWIAAKVTLATSTNTSTPEVYSFTLRGLPLPTESDYAIPVNVSDRIEIPHRRPLLVPGLGEQVRDDLLDLVGSSATVTLLWNDEQVKGQLKGVSEPTTEIPERGSPSVYALLTIRGQRQ